MTFYHSNDDQIFYIVSLLIYKIGIKSKGNNIITRFH